MLHTFSNKCVCKQLSHLQKKQSAHNTVNTITYSFRITRLLIHITTGVFSAAVLYPFCSQVRKHRLIQWWSTKILNILNVEVMTTGEVPESNANGSMYVSNHISWVDIHALMSITSLRFIAKSDIRKWPVFGYLAATANVLFIDRGKRQEAGRVVNTAIESLKNGDHLCLFPEGTTTDGTHILPFKGSLIQAAIDAKSSIQPVAIFYPNADNSANTLMAYAGETTMQASMATILKQRASKVTLHFFTPINIADLSPSEQERRTLSKYIHQLISAQLYH